MRLFYTVCVSLFVIIGCSDDVDKSPANDSQADLGTPNNGSIDMSGDGADTGSEALTCTFDYENSIAMGLTEFVQIWTDCSDGSDYSVNCRRADPEFVWTCTCDEDDETTNVEAPADLSGFNNEIATSYCEFDLPSF